MSEYQEALVRHYESFWGPVGRRIRLSEGPLWELPEDYCVLMFPPRIRKRRARLWFYATCGMSQPEEEDGLEIFIESGVEAQSIVEILNMTAHFHRTGERLGMGHTVNLGFPWLKDSKCDYGLLSLPYLDGPRLEKADILGHPIRVLWFIPITKTERDFKMEHGLEALEQLFEKKEFNYADPKRPCVV